MMQVFCICSCNYGRVSPLTMHGAPPPQRRLSLSAATSFAEPVILKFKIQTDGKRHIITIVRFSYRNGVKGKTS
jgi:hypothetical protein